MEKKAVPYEGTDRYLFFSYCQNDRALVLPLLEELTRQGYRIWFDAYSDEQPTADAADRLEKCHVFVPAITPAYCRSQDCQDELAYALDTEKQILPLLCQQLSLLDSMRLPFLSRPYVKLLDLDTSAQLERLDGQELLSGCVRRTQYAEPLATQPTHPSNPSFLWLHTDWQSPNEQTQSLDPLPPTEQIPERAETQNWSVIRLSDGNVLPWIKNDCLLESDAGIYIGDGVPQLRLQSEVSAFVDGAAAQDWSYLTGAWHTIEIRSEIYVVCSGQAAQWLLNGNWLFYLTADSTGEIKTIPLFGLPLGRRFKWHTAVMENRHVGRNHGKLFWAQGQLYYGDSSKNGSYLNEKRIQNQTVPIRVNDVLRIGQEQFRLCAAEIHSETARKEKLYQEASALLENTSEENLSRAAVIFQELGDYRDSKPMMEKCLEEAEKNMRNSIYSLAVTSAEQDTLPALEEALALLESIGDWLDSDALRSEWQQRREELLRTEQEQEWNRIYQSGIAAMKNNRYDEALQHFSSIAHWKSTEAFLTVCAILTQGEAELSETAAPAPQQAQPADRAP